MNAPTALESHEALIAGLLRPDAGEATVFGEASPKSP
jgi:hypothetical protein